jgi:hypothetical protein
MPLSAPAQNGPTGRQRFRRRGSIGKNHKRLTWAAVLNTASRRIEIVLFVKGVLFTQSPIRACGFIGPFAEHSGARRSSFYEQ